MLKSFDFFRKIQTDQEYTSTTGGIFTMAALIIGAVLIFMSFQDFYHETYYTFLAVKNDQAVYFPLRIDLTLNRMPCQAIEITFHDQLEYHQDSLETKLEMFEVTTDGKQIAYKRTSNAQTEIQAFKTAQSAKSMCRITGILNLPKTPGTLTLKPTANAIVGGLGNAAKDINMAYMIKTMEFGLGNNTFEFPIAHASKTIQKYVSDLQDNINSRTVVLDFSNDTDKVSYYNHVKIIPITIEHSSGNVETGDKYRYSLRSAKGPLQTMLPEIQFLTEIEPIHIVYKKKDPSVYELVVKILAVVGGSVATIGIINSLSHALFGIK